MKRKSTSGKWYCLSSLSFFIPLIFSFLFLMDSAKAQTWMENAKDPSGNLNFYKVQANFNEYWKNRKPQKGSGYKQFKRWEYYWESRINKDGSFPRADLSLGRWEKYLRDNKNNISKRNQQANWESLGPSTTPGGYAGLGRINAICFDPVNSNIIWVGSPSGGLWKSNDNGATWSTNSDNFTILGVSGIVINPVNPNIMYIATGDGDGGDNPSIGVLKSIDGGVTWSNTGLNWAASNGLKIRRILIDQNDVNTILVASNIGVYVSNDAGASWSQKVSGDFWDIRANPIASTDIFYACTGDKIFKSVNNGNNWVEKYTIPGLFPYRTALGVSPADPAVLYALNWDPTAVDGTFGGLYKSIDAGETFTTQSTTPCILDGTPDGSGYGNQGWYDLCLTVDPTNASVIYTGGIVTWKSTDSGVTWTLNNFWYNLGNGTPIVHADKHAYEWQNNTTLWSGNDGGVYKTTNGGTSWSHHSNGLVISQMYRLGTSQADTKVITGLQDNGTKLRSSGGVWSDVLGGDGMECIINPTNSGVMYACIQQGELHRSTNGGLSFTDIQNNIPGQPEGSWVTPYALDPQNPATIYAGYDQLWKSTNQGDTWTSIASTEQTNNSNKTLVEVAPSDPNVIIAGTPIALFKTVNGGASWAAITCPPGYISMLEIHPTNPSIIWATNQNYSGAKVYKSTDGGASWTDFSGTLPGLPANCIVYDKNSNGGLYVGLDVGIYYRDDSMSDWILFSDNLPNVEVWELDINYHEQKLYAATYGRGLWKSDLYELDFIVQGNKTICSDLNWNYTVPDVSGATSYTWMLPSGWTGSSTTNNITVNPSSTSGTVQCVVGLPSGNRTYTLAVTVNSSCNTALDLDGTNDYVECNSGAINLSNSSFTIEFWTKRGTAGTTDILINQGPSTTNSRLHIGFRSNNQFTMDFYANALNVPGSYSDDQWHHWSCVYDKSISSPNHNRFIYRDGILIASDRTSSDFLGNGVFEIGKYNSEFYGGKVDEIRVWNVARSVSEIRSNMFCPLLSPPVSLQLYLPFEDGLAAGDNRFDSETIDFSGNNNHGSMVNLALEGINSNFVDGEKPKIVTGSNTVCPNLNWTYSINPVQGATSYTWTLPSGWSGTSTTNLITVLPSTTNGNVQCIVAAPCGNMTFSLAVSVNAVCNTAMHFDGSNDYLQCQDFSFDHNQPVTVEFWTKVNSADVKSSVLFSVGGTSFTDRFMAHVPWSDQNLYWDYGDASGNGRLSLSFTPYLDKWVHVALVSAGNSGNLRAIYINGNLVASNSGASDGPNGTMTSLQLGGNGDYVKSKVDEFRIWNVMRTQAEIQANMFCPLTSTPSSLKVYYPFENGIPEGTNTETNNVLDFSGNNKHANVFNMALTGTTSNFTTGPDVTRYADSDGDGFGNPSVSTTSFCQAGPHVLVAGDCDDTNANINPYSAEVCGNSIDDDCDGNTDLELNKALNFAGSGHSISIPVVAHSSAFTAEMWIKTSTSGFQNLIQWTGGSPTATFAISGSSLIGYFEGGGFHGGINVADNVWHHVALVHNGYGSNNIKAYVDGVLRLETTLNNVITNTGTVIGSGFNGNIDDVRFWNVALTQSQIQSRMNVRLDGNETNLIRYYPLDHGNPGLNNIYLTSARDRTSNNLHGVLSGFSLTGATSNWVTSWTYPTIYADADADGYGGSTTWSCGTMTGYQNVSSDCDDNNPNVNPYSIEVCGNSTDDDCDGSTDLEINKALHFNGSGGNRVTLPNLVHSEFFTVEAWIKVPSGNTWRQLVQWGGGATAAELVVYSDNRIGYFEGSGNTGDVVADNEWHHIALVHNGYGSNNILIYVDGKLSLNNVTWNNVIANTSITLGARSSGNNPLNGTMDDIRFWNVALTQSQILSRMNLRLDGNETNLVRYYTFDHGKPSLDNAVLTVARDKTSNGADGTLINFALTGSTSNWVTSWTYPTLYADNDGDGFGGTTTTWTCGSMTGFTTHNLDCADNDNTRNPNATDICGNGMDENCNGVNDENTLSLHLDGSNDNVTFGNVLGNFGSGDFTIEARIKSTNTDDYILSKREGCGCFNMWNLSINGSGKIRIEMYENNSCANGGSVSSTTAINDGNWHHFAIVRKSGAIRIYIDGLLDGSGILTTNLNNTTVLSLGSNPCGNPFGGEIDELRIWNIARTGAEVNAFKNAVVPGSVPGLLAYYDFNHPTAQVNGTNTGLNTLTDHSSNGYNGTLNNFALSGTSSNWKGNPGTTLTWYADADGDTYGNPNVSLSACAQPNGYVLNNTDCNDGNNSINPEAPEIVGNSIDDDCDGNIDEIASVIWVPLGNGSSNTSCTSTSNCCNQTFCFGLQFTPATTGTLASYTTGFLMDCNAMNSPIVSNTSCVMDDNSYETISCMGPNGVLINSSGSNGSFPITSGVPVIIHQICLNLPDNSSKTIIEDFITDISMSIDLPVSGAVDEYPIFQTFTVNGNIPPVITLGSIATCYQTNSAAEAAAISATSATDDCPGPITYSATTTGTCSAVVTVTATDACGLQSSVMYNTSIDNSTPVVIGSITTTTVEGCVVADAPAAVTTVAALEALTGNLSISDACTSDADLVVSSTQTSTGTCPIVITRTYKVTDACTNTSVDIIHTINVDDNTAPAVTGTLSPTTMEGCVAGDAPAALTTVAALEALTGNLSISDACTSDADLVVSSTQTSTGTCPIVITRIYKVTDACSNTSVDIIHTINVDDNTAPVVTGTLSPATVEGCVVADAPAAVTTVAALEALPGNLAISDACTSDADLVVSSTQTSTGTCPIVITRTYKVTDACTNTSVDIIHTINVDDNTAPVVSGSITATTVEGCVAGDAPAALTTVTALEALTGNLSISDACTSDANLVVSSTQTSTGTCPIVITRTYKVTDACSNTSVDIIHTINVDDNTAPVVTGTLSPATVEGCVVADAPAAVTTVAALEALPGNLAISDACTSDADLVVSSSQTSTGTCPIVITRTYKVTDACTNTSVDIIHTINVDDNTAPVVTGTLSPTTMEGCSVADAPAAVTTVVALEALTGNLSISDACTSDANLVVSSTQTSTGTCPIVITRTYKVTDACTNTSVDIIHTINVDDNTAPVVTGTLSPATVEGCVVADAPAALTTVAALEALTGNLSISDACTSDANLVVSSTQTSTGTCPIVITRIYKVTDACTNTSVDIIHTINVDDNTAPVVTGTLSPATVEGCVVADAPAAVTTVAALEALPGNLAISDACTSDADLVVSSSQTSTGTCPIVITRIYKVTDACTNTSVDIIHTINVDDNTAPVVTGTLSPATVEGCVVADAPAALTTVAALEALTGNLSISDACTSDADLVVSSTQTSTGTCPIVITRTYKVTDACTNTSVDIIHTINVDDNTAPAVTGSITPTTVFGCNASVAPAAVTSVSALEGLAGNPSISDLCTEDANLAVTHNDVSSGSCPIVVTRTYTIRDACLNASTIVHTINVVRPNNIMEVGGPVTNSAIIESSLYAVTPSVLPVFHDGCGNTLTPAGPMVGGTFIQGGCTGTITYTYTYTDCAGNMASWVFTYNLDCKKINIKVNLQGSYSVSGDSIRTDLNRLRLLPGQDKLLSGVPSIMIGAPFTPFGQPYSALPWNYSGNTGINYGDPSSPNAPVGVIQYPKHVVDWVLVTLRENSILPAGNIFRCAGWIHKNGEVTFPETCPNVLTINTSSSYYILVEHRNHLAVLDTASIIDNGAYLNLDFSLSNSYAPIFRHGQNLLEPGVWGMIEGNAEQVSSRAVINSSDRTAWKNDQNKLGYNKGDIDMNSVVNSLDETKWKLSQNKSTGIIFN